ncbi:unnamed protein product [Brachionus calyciflorus]|uniref:HAT C-terminal dimerisation domain-containing protein n=1 Tax=Brachionus calyciflorus TaxID=104777 RepID=A0A814P831_9BILA|nr:unnamed protein product [Brachionus calyciflorus]
MDSNKKIVTSEDHKEKMPPTKKLKLDVWQFIEEQQFNENLRSPTEVELECYLKEQTANKELDIFAWWFDNKNRFPSLYKLINKYLIVPATSCPAERVFSKAGEIIDIKRSNLKPKNVNNLIFLNKNL